PMSTRDLGGDREPEARAAALACLVAAAEADEGTVEESGGEAPAAVGDVELDESVPVFRAQPNRAAAVTERVLDERSERLLDAQPVHVDRNARRRSLDRATGTMGAGREAERHAFEQFGHRNGLAAERQRVLVQPGDQEQVLGELRESVDLLADRRERGGQFVRRPVLLERVLDLETEPREGGPKLVARIGDEAALAQACLLHAGEHFVERLAELRDLV